MPVISLPVSNVNLICFSDLTGHFGPLTDLRDFVDCRNAALTNFERICKSMGKIPLILSKLIHKESTMGLDNDRDNRLKSFMPENGNLFLNERIIDWQTTFSQFNDLFTPEIQARPLEKIAYLDASGDLLLAYVPAGLHKIGEPWPNEQALIEQFKLLARPAGLNHSQLAVHPWHIQDHLMGNLAFDLSLLANDDDYLFFPKGDIQTAADWMRSLGLEEQASVCIPMQALTVIDTREGAVAIHKSASIQPFTSLVGPVHVGPECKLLSHSQLRKGASIGPACKVAGEISHSIIQGYTNKSHAGYLGNSLVGEWVNLGANTSVSNLKNNYGRIKVQLNENLTKDSGRTFLGPVIGDYVRTAIGTTVTTGAIVGTGSMLAASGLTPKYIPRFSWLTDTAKTPENAPKYDFGKFIETATRMMARRKCQLSDEKLALLKCLYENAA